MMQFVADQIKNRATIPLIAPYIFPGFKKIAAINYFALHSNSGLGLPVGLLFWAIDPSVKNRSLQTSLP